MCLRKPASTRYTIVSDRETAKYSATSRIGLVVPTVVLGLINTPCTLTQRDKPAIVHQQA